MFRKIFKILYIILAIIQFSAMITGFVEVFGVFFGFIAAIIIAPMPIVGEIFGMIGAKRNWGWSTFSTIILFWGLPIFGMVCYIMDKWKDNSTYYKYNINNQSLIRSDNIISNFSDFSINNTTINEIKFNLIKKNEVNFKKENAVIIKSCNSNVKPIKVGIDNTNNQENAIISIFNGKWGNYKYTIEILNNRIMLIDVYENIMIKEVVSINNDYYIFNATNGDNSIEYCIEMHLLDLSELFIFIKKNGKEYLKGTFKKRNGIFKK